MANYDYVVSGSGAISAGVTVEYSQSMITSDGGVVSKTTLNAYNNRYGDSGGASAYMSVGMGGSAAETTVAQGTMQVLNGGSASDTTLNGQYAHMAVSTGGKSDDTTVKNGGKLYVLSGGSATGLNIEDTGYMEVDVTSKTVLAGTSHGKEIKVGDNVTSNVTIYYNRKMYVADEWTAYDTTLNAYNNRYGDSGGASAYMDILTGGAAVRTNIKQGEMVVSQAGSASGTVLNGEYAYMTVLSGGKSDDTTVKNGGKLYVSAGGSATGLNIEDTGYMEVDVTSKTVLAGTSHGKEIKVGDNVTSNVTIYYNRKMYVADGWTAYDTTLNAYNNRYGDSGGASAYMNILAGGSAVNTVVSQGTMTVYKDGVADSVTLKGSYANLVISSGGVLTGENTFKTNSVITVQSGAIVDFDISDRTTEDDVLYNDITMISGAPTYTITVNRSQDTGVYKLAANASGFNGTVTVTNGYVNYYKNLMVGGSFIYNDIYYNLYTDSESGYLMLNVVNSQKLPGDVVTLDAPLTSATENMEDGEIVSVTVKATFDEDAVINQYTLNGTKWFAYEDNGVTLTENGAVWFRSISSTGVVSEVSQYKVSAIPAPEETPEITINAPILIANVTAETEGPVTVTATFDSRASYSQYSLNGLDWLACTPSADGTMDIVFTENGTVYFRSFVASSETPVLSYYTVGNIVAPELPPVVDPDDTTPPAAPIAYADKTEYTEGTVKVTAQFSDDSYIREYSLDGKSWEYYTGAVEFYENGVIYFRAADAAGNVSEITKYEVGNIAYTSPYGDEWLDMQSRGGNSNQINRTGSFMKSSWYGDWVGSSDNFDYTAFTLDYATNLSFNVYADDAITFEIYELKEKVSRSGDVTYTLANLVKTGVAAGNMVPTANKLLMAGTYYVKVTSTNKNADKYWYNFSFSDRTVIYDKADNSDNWNDVKTMGKYSDFYDDRTIGTVNEVRELVADGWVGYSDSVDYMKFTLEDAASLSLDISASDAAKVVIYQLTENKNGTFSLKALQTTAVGANYTVPTKNILLEAGDYYIGVTSTNAAKGGNADYSISVSDRTTFFEYAYNRDDWTDVKNTGAAGLPANNKIGQLNEDTKITDWVGYSDAVDYYQFDLATVSKISFDVYATGDDSKFVIYELVEKTNSRTGETTYSLKQKLSQTVKAGCIVPTKELLLTNGTYYFSMTSINAKKGGDSIYRVTVNENRSEFYAEAADNTDDSWSKVKSDAAANVSNSGVDMNGWVGFSDKSDFFKLETDGTGIVKLSLDDATAEAYENKELKITCLNKNGAAVAMVWDSADDVLKSKSILAADTVLYVGVSTANEKQYETSYNITAMLA